MKKVLSITMSIFMLISMFAFCASAKNPTYGDYEYKVTEDGTVTIVKYHGDEAEVTIPNKIGGKKVTVIGKYAFYNNAGLKSVTVPNSVVTIKKCAFLFCEQLNKISLGKNIKSIEYGSFGETAYTNKTTHIDYNGCLYIGNYLIGVDSVELAETIENTVRIKEGTVLIADQAFDYAAGYPKIKKIILPDSLKYIGEQAFAGHDSLETVKFGKNIVSIGEKAFYDCTNLKNVKIPASVKTIGKHAFGYTYNNKAKKYETIKGFTITGYANTAAEKYANKNGIEFKFQKPQTPKVKITAGDKKIKVKYTKALGADGFQISYTVGKKTYTKTYETAKTTTKTLKNLKKGTYQVKVRAFTKTDTKKIYSKWTDTISVKVK